MRLAAPPVDGAANEALIAFLSEVLGVPRRNLALVAGEKSRDKRVRVDGIDLETAMTRLARWVLHCVAGSADLQLEAAKRRGGRETQRDSTPAGRRQQRQPTERLGHVLAPARMAAQQHTPRS